MQISLRWIYPVLLFIVSSAVFAEDTETKAAANAQLIFSIAINAPQDAAFTEIEFSDIDLSKATDAEKITGARVKTVRTKDKTFREYLSPEVKFFRVRSIHKTGVAGPYSQTQAVEKFLRKAYREPTIPLVQQGQTEYLLGSRIELPVQPNLVTKYRLGDGEFLEYREPLVFDKPDTYRMEVQLENAQKQVVFKKNFVFKVELNPPKTRVVIVNPVHAKRGISVGKESSIVFLVDDAESGMAKIFYRITAVGKDINAAPFTEYGNRLTHSEMAPHGSTMLIQYYAIDKAGNKEEIRSEVLFCEN